MAPARCCFGLLAACLLGPLAAAALQQARGPGNARLQAQQQPQGPQQAQLLPASQLQAPASGSLVANINCNKIRGHVTLTPGVAPALGLSSNSNSNTNTNNNNNNNNNVNNNNINNNNNNLAATATLQAQITAGPPGEVYQWAVHQFPVKPGAGSCSCSQLVLGSKLLDLAELHGNLASDQELSVPTSLALFGPDSPVGHSLLLRGIKTGVMACATFLPTSRKSTYRAKFHAPLSGSVTIFQTAFGTSLVSHLMYSNGTRRHSVHRFELVRGADDDLVASSLLAGALGGGAQATAAAQAAASIGEQREFDHELVQCRRLNAEPLLRNHSLQLSVSTEQFGMRGRTALVLPPIAFETLASVYVLIYPALGEQADPNGAQQQQQQAHFQQPEAPIACAPLRFVRPKTAAAKFQSVSVQGSVVFAQDSPYDPTVTRVQLQLANGDGHSYGIDELPMIIRRKSDTRVCPNVREIIYNPHHVEPSSVPAEAEATSDQYAVGDLSGKYGSLAGKTSEKLHLLDHNLPLFGPSSVVGRAMTIYSAEGLAIACSNVELTAPMTTAFATFDHGIQGQFIFRQPLNDCNADTYVYIEVSKPAGASSSAGSHSQRSLDHNWHIHSQPVDSGLDHLSSADCAQAGPHFNPYNTSTSSIYARDCTPFNALRCELGDLSAKMFTLEIPPYRVKAAHEPDIGKFFATDIDLPLCGPASVVNRSVVVHVHDFGAARLACSTVIEFKPRL